VNKEVIKAQLDLYINGRQQALQALEKAKADYSAFNGAIEACENLMRIEEELTQKETKEE